MKPVLFISVCLIGAAICQSAASQSAAGRWGPINSPHGRTVYEFAVDDAREAMYAATDQGVWVYQDAAWRYLTLRNSGVRSVAVTPEDHIAAVTWQGGLAVIDRSGNEQSCFGGFDAADVRSVRATDDAVYLVKQDALYRASSCQDEPVRLKEFGGSLNVNYGHLVLANTAEGVFMSADGGDSWADLGNPGLSSSSTLRAFRTNDGAIIAYAFASAARWDHYAEQWSRLDLPPNQTIRAHAETEEGALLLAIGRHIYRSDNGGAAWSEVWSSPFKTPISMAAGRQGTVVVGFMVDALAFTTDDEAAKTGADIPIVDGPTVADFFGGAMRSDDGGATWRDMGEGLTIQALGRFLDVDEPASYILTRGGAGLYRAAGRDFLPISPPDLNHPIIGATTDGEGLVFAVTADGVLWRHESESATWEMIVDVDFHGILSLAYIESGYLAALHDGELWVIDLNAHQPSPVGVTTVSQPAIMTSRGDDLVLADVDGGIWHGSGSDVIESLEQIHHVNAIVSDLVFDNTASNTIVATDDGMVYRISTSGQATAISGPDMGTMPHYVSRSPEGTVYAFSSDGCLYWEAMDQLTLMNCQLQQDTVRLDFRSFHIDGNGSGYAATPWDVFFFSNLTGTSTDELPQQVTTACLNAYPNPTSGRITLELGDSGGVGADDRELILWTVLGQRVASRNVSARAPAVTMDLHELAARRLSAGLYFIEAASSDLRCVVPVMVNP